MLFCFQTSWHEETKVLPNIRLKTRWTRLVPPQHPQYLQLFLQRLMGKHRPMQFSLPTTQLYCGWKKKTHYTAQKSHHFKHVITQQRHTRHRDTEKMANTSTPRNRTTHTFKSPVFVNSERYAGVSQRYEERVATLLRLEAHNLSTGFNLTESWLTLSIPHHNP